MFELIKLATLAPDLFVWCVRFYLGGPQWYRLADGRRLHRSEYFAAVALACLKPAPARTEALRETDPRRAKPELTPALSG